MFVGLFLFILWQSTPQWGHSRHLWLYFFVNAWTYLCIWATGSDSDKQQTPCGANLKTNYVWTQTLLRFSAYHASVVDGMGLGLGYALSLLCYSCINRSSTGGVYHCLKNRKAWGDCLTFSSVFWLSSDCYNGSSDLKMD